MSDQTLVGINIQGGLLPAAFPMQIATGHDPHGDSLTPQDYHLPPGETVRDAANRVWAYLRGVWTGYQEALAKLPDGAPTTALTRDRFLLVLLDQLGYGRVPTTRKGGLTSGGEHFPISHEWGSVPIHLLGTNTPLDTRTKGVAGAAGSSPQSMIQEYLNRSDDHLWAILSNGNVLRLLRDSTSLVGSAYIEFDLAAIFDGDLFVDFLVLYSLCHVSRVEVRDADIGPASCWLEQWRTEGIETGSRALNLLRDGVIEALRTLGAGFLTHPANAQLRADLERNAITIHDVNHALLRVVYRLLFTFVAEDRQALLDPTAPHEAKLRYHNYFSTDRLRRTARRRHGGRHSDRWKAQTLVWKALGDEAGLPDLGIVGIGGLFDEGELDFLTDCNLSNASLLRAVRSLSLIREPKSGVFRVVDYRNLGAEELGSIYEALLELVPHWDGPTKQYTLDVAAGNQRKDTGSYYTPTSLVDSLLDTALEPVLDDAVKSANDAEGQEQALLAVTVCDPACGSGHFLVGAARRIAKHVAALRTGDPEPAPGQVRAAMRDVVATSIYGVDVNPLAAELAKVSLWMEALEPGRPLAYLDSQIKVGNALLGTTPKLLADGLPDEAFKPIEGDDKRIASATAKANKAERINQGGLFGVGDLVLPDAQLTRQVEGTLSSQTLALADVHVQRQRMRSYETSPELELMRLAADTWSSAFMWPLTNEAPSAPTFQTVADLAAGSNVLTAEQRSHVATLTAQYRFFHWHLEFPHVFADHPAAHGVNDTTGWSGGFSVVIGNPPWERVKLQEQEFFAARDPEIASAPNAAQRKKLIKALPSTNASLYEEFLHEKRKAEGISHFLRLSQKYPLTGRGDINTYAVFAETDRNLLGPTGRLGVILPTGIATDATTQFYFKDLVENGSIASLYDFENSRPLFDGVHRSFKFCLLTLCGRAEREPQADFAFFAHDPVDLDRPDTRFTLSPEEITLLNPNTGTCPVFRSRRDAEITLGIYKRVPVLIKEGDPNGNPWDIKFMRMFDMSNDANLFHTREELEHEGWILNGNVFERRDQRMVPLYQGMMATFYNHRAADIVRSPTATKRQNQPRYLTDSEWSDTRRLAIPGYWVAEDELPDALPAWLLAFSSVTSPTNERSMVSYLIPRTAVGNSTPLLLLRDGRPLVAILSSFVLDYALRQKLGGVNLNYIYVEQLPVPTPKSLLRREPWSDGVTVREWIESRVMRLSYTAVDMEAGALSYGVKRQPYPWDPEDRSETKFELDAAMFHLYEVEREDVIYIMDSFPIVKRRDDALFGHYRTKSRILQNYDRMSAGIA